MLPIESVLPELVRAVTARGAAVLVAPPGAGKTTRVPPALLPHVRGQIVMLEPRRVAARAAAGRMAFEHGSAVGQTFGYAVRFDKKLSAATRCAAVTPGVLLRMLHDDPFLETVGCVVFDEFHERGLDADLVLGLVKLLRDTVRPDLHVVVMSATLAAESVSAYLGGCPVVRSEGRAFPVDVRYKPRRGETPAVDAAAAAVRELLGERPGDVLVFLPGLREIRTTASLLADVPALVLPLHGELPPEEQDRALKKHDRRKVVLATNVAETSVTVDGVTAVVDTGLARTLEFDAGVGMDRLRLGPISKAAAEQRAGRAGRQAPGVCVRLWDELGHRARPDHTEPEIRRADLAPAVLHLLAAGETNILAFPWFDPPKPEAVARAVDLLTRLGAVGDTALTPLGEKLAALPAHPRLGRLLLAGAEHGCSNRAALAAAILSDRDPFDRTAANGNPPPTASDVLAKVEAVEHFDRTGRLDTPLGRLHPGGVRATLQGRDQFRRLIPANDTGDDSALLRAVFAAYPDRLAKRRGPGDRRAVLVGGRGVKLAPASGVLDGDLFVAVDVEAGGVESFVRAASGVERAWLTGTVTRHEIEFDPAAEKLVARKRTRVLDLILDDVQGHFADDGRAAEVLAEAAAARLDRVLPAAESAAGSFLARWKWLTGVATVDLPPPDEEFLRAVLPAVWRGKRSLADVRGGPWLDAIRGHLTYSQYQLVEREAPGSLTVPTGSEIPLSYEPGRPPVLAVRIQELFGLAETPRVAGGRVKVLLHLLAPNYRPQQVTDDLASFWANGYPVVRKDLRGRYPKHDWPDDPTTATPIRGPKKRAT